MTKAIAQKILLVMGEIEAIDKKRSGTVNYAFQHWDEVRAELRAACLKHKLVIVPHAPLATFERIDQEGKTAQYQWQVSLKFDIIDPDTGDLFTGEWQGEARDTSDKGLQKACTSGMKYWLLKTFQIADREASDHDEAPAPVTQTSSVNGQKDDMKAKVRDWLTRHVTGDDAADGRKALWQSFQGNFGADAGKVLLGCDSLEMAQAAIRGDK